MKIKIERSSFFSSRYKVIAFFVLSLLLHILFLIVYYYLPSSTHLYHRELADEKNQTPIVVEFEQPKVDELPAELRPGFVKPVEIVEKENSVEAPINIPRDREIVTEDEEEFEVEGEEESSSQFIETIDLKKEALKNLFRTEMTPKKEIGPQEVISKRALFVPSPEEKPILSFSSTYQDSRANSNGNHLMYRAGDPTKIPNINDFRIACYIRRLFERLHEAAKAHERQNYAGDRFTFHLEINKEGKLLCLEQTSHAKQKELETKLYKDIKSLFPIFPIPQHLNRESIKIVFFVEPYGYSLNFF